MVSSGNWGRQPPSIATQGRFMSRKHQTSVLRQWLMCYLGCYDALGTTIFSWSLNNCQDLGEGSHRVGYGTVLMANYSSLHGLTLHFLQKSSLRFKDQNLKQHTTLLLCGFGVSLIDGIPGGCFQTCTLILLLTAPDR